jgi:tRNA (guanine-N7-)-methyltransferase
MKAFPNVIQPPFSEVMNRDHANKGSWATKIFKNSNPLVLELGCGKGEYTVGLAMQYPGKNFLGVDIKGARIWTGAREAIEKGLGNVAFLRTRIEMIGSFFAPQEVSEIWLTFPDPQLKIRRNKKRLTASRFLNAYHQFLQPTGYIHLKTDSRELYFYTLELLKINNVEPIIATEDLHGQLPHHEAASITTFYEKQFLSKGMKICYLCFVPGSVTTFQELTHEKGRSIF